MQVERFMPMHELMSLSHCNCASWRGSSSSSRRRAFLVGQHSEPRLRNVSYVSRSNFYLVVASRGVCRGVNAEGKTHVIKVSHLSANGANAAEGSSHDDSSSIFPGALNFPIQRDSLANRNPAVPEK